MLLQDLTRGLVLPLELGQGPGLSPSQAPEQGQYLGQELRHYLGPG